MSNVRGASIFVGLIFVIVQSMSAEVDGTRTTTNIFDDPHLEGRCIKLIVPYVGGMIQGNVYVIEKSEVFFSEEYKNGIPLTNSEKKMFITGLKFYLTRKFRRSQAVWYLLKLTYPNYSRGEKYFQKATAKQKEMWDALDEAEDLVEAGEFSRARTRLNDVRRIDPTYPGPNYILGLIELKKGNKNAAKYRLDMAFMKGYKVPSDVNEKLRNLESGPPSTIPPIEN